MAGRDHPRPYLTVDVVAFGDGQDGRSLLLVQRAHEPFQGQWALPGGFVEEGERTREAAARELLEETGLRLDALSLLGVYDAPGRDPRGWTVSVIYLATVAGQPPIQGADDARDARWWPVAQLPELAFDHAEVVADGLAAVA